MKVTKNPNQQHAIRIGGITCSPLYLQTLKPLTFTPVCSDCLKFANLELASVFLGEVQVKHPDAVAVQLTANFIWTEAET